MYFAFQCYFANPGIQTGGKKDPRDRVECFVGAQLPDLQKARPRVGATRVESSSSIRRYYVLMLKSGAAVGRVEVVRRYERILTVFLRQFINGEDPNTW